MGKFGLRGVLAALAVMSIVSFASADLLSDAFDGDTSANYTVVDDGAPDGTVTFGFDYVAAGIPLAPNSAAGSGMGLRFTANDTAGATDAFTAFHNTSVTGSYTMMVDMYMAVTGTGGTTEYSHIGVGGNGTTFNSVFTPISGSGAFLAMTGEGGSGSSDYRHFIQETTTVPTDDPSYLAGSGANTAELYQSIFPNTNGAPTNLWVEVQIDVVTGGTTNTVTYSLNGTPIVVANTAYTDGLVSLGYADVFSSVASPFQSQFVVYDNLRVVPEPGSLLLLALGALAVVRRR